MSSPQVLVHILSQIPLLMLPKWLHSGRRHHCCYRLTAWRYIGHGRRHGIIFHSLLHWQAAQAPDCLHKLLRARWWCGSLDGLVLASQSLGAALRPCGAFSRPYGD
ncbi:hypothetical protein IG631_06972 [Alternaria alternata]|nr:hypothetical protein IG631_06972 [Alternaria alternata]